MSHNNPPSLFATSASRASEHTDLASKILSPASKIFLGKNPWFKYRDVYKTLCEDQKYSELLPEATTLQAHLEELIGISKTYTRGTDGYLSALHTTTGVGISAFDVISDSQVTSAASAHPDSSHSTRQTQWGQTATEILATNRQKSMNDPVAANGRLISVQMEMDRALERLEEKETAIRDCLTKMGEDAVSPEATRALLDLTLSIR